MSSAVTDLVTRHSVQLILFAAFYVVFWLSPRLVRCQIMITETSRFENSITWLFYQLITSTITFHLLRLLFQL